MPLCTETYNHKVAIQVICVQKYMCKNQYDQTVALKFLTEIV